MTGSVPSTERHSAPGSAAQTYPDGKCPDCGFTIPTTAEPGETCANCEHVWWPVTTPAWVGETKTLDVSDYAKQHAEHYGLRKRAWYGGRVVCVELALMDAEGEFIDEAGCNCDLDSPCNNPRCVMERGHFY